MLWLAVKSLGLQYRLIDLEFIDVQVFCILYCISITRYVQHFIVLQSHDTLHGLLLAS